MKRKLGLEGRTTILTAGLLGPGKGIETLLQALPEIVRQVPNVLYILLGATHPNLVHTHGETYRDRLKRQVCHLNLEQHVLFHNAFVSQTQLCEYLAGADFYVTPYPKAEQVTSGTLAYAVGAGCTVVSTPYWHAQELLADGCGCLVPTFSDASALAKAIIALVKDPIACQRMRCRAYRAGRKMIWPVVGQAYQELFSDVKGGIATPTVFSSLAPLDQHAAALVS
jgi:glycosyltransferase involved in cell wall biosynthesis